MTQAELDEEQRITLDRLSCVEGQVVPVHPFDLETPEQRARRVAAQVEELEWQFRRQSAEHPRPIDEEDTVPGHGRLYCG